MVDTGDCQDRVRRFPSLQPAKKAPGGAASFSRSSVKSVLPLVDSSDGASREPCMSGPTARSAAGRVCSNQKVLSVAATALVLDTVVGAEEIGRQGAGFCR